MPQATSQPTAVVQNVDGKEQLVWKVQGAQDVRELLDRLENRPKLRLMVLRHLHNEDFGAWLWGERSFALVEVHDSPLHGRVASLEWLESEQGFSTKKQVAPCVEQWAKNHGAKFIVTMVYQHKLNAKLWQRLTGWKPWALAIGKEL